MVSYSLMKAYTADESYSCWGYTYFSNLVGQAYTFYAVNRWMGYNSGLVVYFAAYTCFDRQLLVFPLWTGWYIPGLVFCSHPACTYWNEAKESWLTYRKIGDL